MAKTVETGTRRSCEIEINGAHRPHGAVDDPVFKVIDGEEIPVSLPIPDGSHHVAAYLAAMHVLAAAHHDGVTDLTVRTRANLFREQVTSQKRADEPALRMLRDLVKEAEGRFDNVRWLPLLG